MTVASPCHRVLIAARAAEQSALGRLFSQPELANWETRVAGSFEEAHFILQYDSCDVLLVDQGLLPREEAAGLAWLSEHGQTPALVLTASVAEVVTAAVEGGADFWLPRELALDYPPLLVAGLDQARRTGDLRRRLRLSDAAQEACRQQVGRLVELLWRHVPIDARSQWFTHRHMLERLQEEVARTERHGMVFSVILGEVRPQEKATTSGSVCADLTAWTSERIRRDKRRCDVAGQYGPHGFMLLLPNTSAAGAERFCARLRQSLDHAATAAEVPLTASFGIASCANPKASVKVLLRQAEENLAVAQQTAEGHGRRLTTGQEVPLPSPR